MKVIVFFFTAKTLQYYGLTQYQHKLSSILFYFYFINMDSPPSYSLSVTGPLSDIGSSGIGGSISSDSVRAHFATTEVVFITSTSILRN